MSTFASEATKRFWLILILLFSIGIFLRLYPSSSYESIGFDESLYMRYVQQLQSHGVFQMPEIVGKYIRVQESLQSAILPPTRFLYIFIAYGWGLLTGANAIDALNDVSAFWSILTLALGAWFSFRLGGKIMCIGTTALMTCAPTQIHMAQHALIDGFFAFWALLSVYLLWENLQQKQNNKVLLAAYGISLILLVLTKENSFFVYVGICGIILLSKIIKAGTPSKSLLICTVIAPTMGVIILILLSGGIQEFIKVYTLLVEKAYQLEYAIRTGDGPWYRYLVDLLLVSPLTFLLCIAAFFRLRDQDKNALYLMTFIAVSYLIMCNIKYGMNLRYTNMWDMPIRFLAFGQILVLGNASQKHKNTIVVLITTFLCLYDLRQYKIFFIDHPLYELVTGGLLQALSILK